MRTTTDINAWLHENWIDHVDEALEAYTAVTSLGRCGRFHCGIAANGMKVLKGKTSLKLLLFSDKAVSLLISKLSAHVPIDGMDLHSYDVYRRAMEKDD